MYCRVVTTPPRYVSAQPPCMTTYGAIWLPIGCVSLAKARDRRVPAREAIREMACNAVLGVDEDEDAVAASLGLRVARFYVAVHSPPSRRYFPAAMSRRRCCHAASSCKANTMAAR